MSDDEVKNMSLKSQPRDYLANERTFLAWVRTSIGIMAFGFVVEKFTLFIKQIALFLGSGHVPIAPIQGYSSIFGACLVGFGVLICLLAFIKYKNVEKQIDENTYQPSAWLSVMVTLAVILIGIFLVVYLNTSI